MNLTQLKRFSPIILGVVLLGAVIGYRITDNIAENKVRARNLAESSIITVETEAVERRNIVPQMIFSAGLEPVWSAEISAKVDGRIETMQVNEGDVVKAGTVIATLDGGDLAGQVMQAERNLLAAESNFEQAQLDFNRYDELADAGAVSMQLLDNARTKRDASYGQVQTAKGALGLVREKEKNLSIVVPRDGVVTKRHLQAGVFVRSGTPLITVADTTTLLAKATVGESQAAGLKAGTSVKVMIDALGGKAVNGIITMISPVAQLPARTFTADIAIDNSEGILKGGMFAKVEMPVAVKGQVLAVPETASILREDQPSVFVIDEMGVANQRIIKTGGTGGGFAEVIEGLSEGEQIVTGGQHKLRDGIKITSAAGGDAQ